MVRRESPLKPGLKRVEVGIAFICSLIDALIEPVPNAIQLAAYQISRPGDSRTSLMGPEQMTANRANIADFRRHALPDLALDSEVVAVLIGGLIIKRTCKDHLSGRQRETTRT